MEFIGNQQNNYQLLTATYIKTINYYKKCWRDLNNQQNKEGHDLSNNDFRSTDSYNKKNNVCNRTNII